VAAVVTVKTGEFEIVAHS